jgi:hypothetical protein
MLTQERLKELLNYDSETGIFTRKTSIAGHKAGSISGASQNKGYIQMYVDGKNYLAHRLAWLYVYGCFPKYQIDHINRNKKDNRIVNLRDVSNSINQHNNTLRSHNTSGTTGVMFSQKRKHWVSQIHIDNKRIYLGTFKDKEMAIQARKNYEKSISLIP